MFIKIEVQHAVKSGLEKEALETIRKLKRKDSDYAACTLWNEWLIRDALTDTEDLALPTNDTEESIVMQDFLHKPAKIKLFLSA